MSKLMFQIVGGLTLGFSAILALMGGFVVLHYPPHSPWEVIPGTLFVGILSAMGLGLFCLRKWAAVGLSVLTLCLAYWPLKDAFHPIPGYANWLGFPFAALLAVPSILTATCWRDLKCR